MPKSARKSPPGRPFQGRGDPRNGRGPQKGAPNAGRPPQEHVDWCRRVLSDRKVEAAVWKVLQNANHPQFATLWGKVADRGYRIIEQGDNGQTRALMIYVVRETGTVTLGGTASEVRLFPTPIMEEPGNGRDT